MYYAPSHSELKRTAVKFKNLSSYIQRISKNGKIKRLTKSQIRALKTRFKNLIKKLTLSSCLIAASLISNSNEGIAQCTDNALDAPLFAPSLGGMNLPGMWASITVGDVNDDGIDDLIAKADQAIQYYKGLPSGTFELQMSSNSNPFFQLVLDPQDDILIYNLIASDVPELIVGKADGTIDVYEIGVSGNYQLLGNNPFDGIDVGEEASVSIGFIDGDIYKDAFVGNRDGKILYFEQDDTAKFIEQAASENPLDGMDVGNRARPFMIDRDGDSILDAAVVGNENGLLRYFIRDVPGPEFIEQIWQLNPFDNISVGFTADPVLTDLNNDGTMDLLVSNLLGNVFSYLLTTEYTETTDPTDLLHEVELGLAKNADPEFYDWDDDGDEDLFVGTSDGTIKYFENIDDDFVLNDLENPFDGEDYGNDASIEFAELFDLGSGLGFIEVLIGADDGRLEIGFIRRNASGQKYLLGTILIGEANVGSYSSPAAIDYDLDGDNDVFIGNGDGLIKGFKNIGSQLIPLMGSDNPFNGIDVGSFAAPVFLDIDGDVYKDALIGNNEGVQYFEYDINNAAFVEQASNNPFAHLKIRDAKPTTANLLNNGRLDLVIGSQAGHVNHFRNFGGSDCYNIPCSLQNSYIGPNGIDWNNASIYWTSSEIPQSCSHVNIPSDRAVEIGMSETGACATLQVQEGGSVEIHGNLDVQP